MQSLALQRQVTAKREAEAAPSFPRAAWECISGALRREQQG
jgi:hypothetical protein